MADSEEVHNQISHSELGSVVQAGTIHQVVLRQPPPVPARPTMRYSLRREIHAFTGRDVELRRLVDAAESPHGAAIQTIDGMPGVGKTALVTRAAHLLAGRFPDGQYFVPLEAHTPDRRPAEPGDVLSVLLTGLGLDPRYLPRTLEGRASLWRDRMAGKRVLLVLDDATDHAQVEPLLPGSDGCLTLITSRRRLVALDGAQPHPLDTLSPDQSAELLVRLAGRAPADRDSEAVARIADLCGHLPLAIVLLAGRLANHPTWTFTHLAEVFTSAKDRLDELVGGNRAVAAAFEMSYHDLSLARQQLFRRLSLHPGLDTDAYAAAALGDVGLVEARRELEVLYTDHLVDEVAPGRYRFHDLVRTYAGTLAARHDSVNDRERAAERLLDYYRRTAEAADHLITLVPRPSAAPPTTSPTAVPDLLGHTDAIDWMRTERANLLACLDYAASTGWHPYVVGLTAAMASFLQKEGPWPQAANLHQRAITCARDGGDEFATAGALHDLGRLRQALGEYRASREAYEQALELYRSMGDRLGEANILNNLGNLGQVTDNLWGGAESYQRALELYQTLGDRLGEANALNNLGRVRQVFGEYPVAADLLQRALQIYRALDNRLGEANTLNSLARVRYMAEDLAAAADPLQSALELYQALDDSQGKANAFLLRADIQEVTDGFPAAIASCGQALELYRTLGNRHGEGIALLSLASLLHLTGEYDAVADLLRQAQSVWQTLGNRQGQGNTLYSLGCLRHTTGRYDDAADLLHQALVIFEDLQDRIGKANAFHALGRVRQVKKDFAAAADFFQKALTQWADLDHRGGQAEVLISLGSLRSEREGPRQALTPYRQALRIARQVKSPLDEARALEGIAQCQKLTGQPDVADATLREAMAIHERLGTAEGRTSRG